MPNCVSLSLSRSPLKEQKASKNEVRVLQALTHPHIVAYHDSFVSAGPRADDAKLFILMEWASGGDLGSLISRRKQTGKRFSEAEILKFTWQMTSALAYCHHDRRLLHRDLKPANIFISADGAVKIGDFGISRFLCTSEALAQTQCGTVCASLSARPVLAIFLLSFGLGRLSLRVHQPLYMSPEMAQGHPYTRAADVWALGCIIYEMMSLSAPWLTQLGPRVAKGLNVPGLMRHISRGVLQTEGLRKHYSDGLCALLCALVSRDPAKRPSLASVLEWPIMQARAPKAIAFAMSLPRRMPPSQRISRSDPTASAMGSINSIAGGAPSSCRPP